MKVKKNIICIEDLFDIMTPHIFQNICSGLEISDTDGGALQFIAIILELEKNYECVVWDNVIDDILIEKLTCRDMHSKITANFREKNLSKILPYKQRQTK